MSELKPCPFCGESKLLYSGGCGFRYDDDDNQIRLFRVHCRTCKGRTGVFESLDEAVEAWNRRTNSTTIQPSELGTNLAEVGTDCISRQAAIDALCNDYCGGHQDCKYYPNCENLRSVQKLPSAQPAEPKKGKWIRTGSGSLYDHYECSECGKAPKWECMGDNRWKIAFTDFCPNCGADMRGEQDG